MRKKNKNKILVHGWLSATLDLLLYACLLALSHSGRHGRATASTCCCCYHAWCCCIAVGCGVATTAALTKKLKERKK